MFANFINNINPNLLPEERMKMLSTDFRGASATLIELNKQLKNWPQMPTDEAEQHIPQNVDLEKYSKCFETLSSLLSPPEFNFEELNRLKESIVFTRQSLKYARENPESNTIERQLEIAKKLHSMLKKQRELENTYIEQTLHLWRTALLTFDTDLNSK